MSPTTFPEAVKDYYDRKSEYLALIAAASEEDRVEESDRATGSKTEAVTQAETPQDHGKDDTASELPSIDRIEGVPAFDPRRAAELVAQLRTSIEKGNNRELKELLVKFDRGMGFSTNPAKSR